jgi:2-oxoisovalerate dehydrogenase E1 component
MMDGRLMEDIALDRARGYTCSSLDPVTGGKHCSIGGNPRNEFLVTSTLASQAPAALGRALAIPLSNRLLGSKSNFAPDAISYVSLGDGSINNAHFLAAINLAKYSEHNRFKCPIVFVVSDNKKCISLKGTGWVDKYVSQLSPMFHRTADGNDVLDLYCKSKEVVDHSRALGRPALLLVNNLARRFGHAATDRQFAYMSAEEISAEASRDSLSDAFALALQLGVLTEDEITTTFNDMRGAVERAFDQAVEEPKITSRQALIFSNSAPIVPPSSSAGQRLIITRTLGAKGLNNTHINLLYVLTSI